MSVHPEDAANYAADLHRDLARIALAVERLAAALDSVTTQSGKVRVDVGRVVTVEDRP